jgi:hypothetical protein
VIERRQRNLLAVVSRDPPDDDGQSVWLRRDVRDRGRSVWPPSSDEALAALEKAPGDRRLVAVVSHVKAVAECIEDVPEVVRTPLGSRAEWRGPSERDALVSEGLEARLLA